MKIGNCEGKCCIRLCACFGVLISDDLKIYDPDFGTNVRSKIRSHQL